MKKTYASVIEINIEVDCPYCQRKQIKTISYQKTFIDGSEELGLFINLHQKSFYCAYCAEKFIMELS